MTYTYQYIEEEEEEEEEYTPHHSGKTYLASMVPQALRCDGGCWLKRDSSSAQNWLKLSSSGPG